MAWTTPRTWVAGETVTAALLNTHVRDNLKAIGDTWTAYTPTWTAATTNPTLGNGTIEGAYTLAGKLVHWRLRLTFGTTTNPGSGLYTFTLPVPAVAAGGIDAGGAGLARDASTTSYLPLTPRLVGSTFDGVTAAGGRLNASTPFTWADGDSIAFSGTYEAA